MRNILSIGRLVWGTDFSGNRHRISLRECVEAFKRLLFLGAEHGYTFSDWDVQDILGGNVTSILKLA